MQQIEKTVSFKITRIIKDNYNQSTNLFKRNVRKLFNKSSNCGDIKMIILESSN